MILGAYSDQRIRAMEQLLSPLDIGVQLDIGPWQIGGIWCLTAASLPSQCLLPHMWDLNPTHYGWLLK